MGTWKCMSVESWACYRHKSSKKLLAYDFFFLPNVCDALSVTFPIIKKITFFIIFFLNSGGYKEILCNDQWHGKCEIGPVNSSFWLYSNRNILNFYPDSQLGTFFNSLYFVFHHFTEFRIFGLEFHIILHISFYTCIN